MSIKPGTTLPSVKCIKCNAVIPFQANLEDLPDEFHAICPNEDCRFDGIYRKSEIQDALARRKQ